MKKAYRSAQAVAGWMRGLTREDAVDLAAVSVVVGITIYFNIREWLGG
jgi:hypothetical protein